MYNRRNKVKATYSKISNKCLISFTICLFIFPPTLYYFLQNNNYYPYRWKFINPLKNLVNISPDLNFLNIYPPINLTHDCSSKFYQCYKTIHGFVVCIHDVFQDQYISVDIKHNGNWQPLLSEFLINVLKNNPAATFIDVGANIGYFSALAASANHYTIAIEPVPQNLELLYCTSVRNDLSNKLTIISNPLSDSHSKVTIRRGGSNQGDGRIEEGVKECTGSCPPTSNSITLNDLLPLIFNQNSEHSVIIKIDAQGFEGKILRGGDHFLKETKIVCIVVEWILMRLNTTLASSVMNTLQLLYTHKFRPYNLDPHSLLSAPLHPTQWRSWPDDVVWFRENDDGRILTT